MKNTLRSLSILAIGIALTFGMAFVAQASICLVSQGCTQVGSLTPYALITGGTTQTAQVQQLSIGTSGQVLTSNGAGTLPTWQTGGGGGGSGTVTTVSVVTNQGVSGTVANATTTPAITLSLGTLTGATWQGNPVGTTYGGTGATSIGATLTNSGSVLGIDLTHANTWTGAPVFSSVPVTLSGSQSASAWTTAGIGLIQSAATYTDTTSSGTVTTVAIDSIGVPTIAASSATTFTNAATLYIAGAPLAGTNATLSVKYGLDVSSGLTLLGGGLQTSTTTTSSNLFAASGTGTSSGSASAIQVGGASTTYFRSGFDGLTSTAMSTVGSSYGNVIVGSSPVTTSSSGTNALLANLAVNPLGTVTSGGATTTTTASLYVAGAGTGGTNNYALDVNSGNSIFGGAVILKGYTVATLPTGITGMTAYVTDALTPSFGTTLVGGGAIVTKAFYNGTNWIAE